MILLIFSFFLNESWNNFFFFILEIIFYTHFYSNHSQYIYIGRERSGANCRVSLDYCQIRGNQVLSTIDSSRWWDIKIDIDYYYPSWIQPQLIEISFLSLSLSSSLQVWVNRLASVTYLHVLYKADMCTRGDQTSYLPCGFLVWSYLNINCKITPLVNYYPAAFFSFSSR